MMFKSMCTLLCAGVLLTNLALAQQVVARQGIADAFVPNDVSTGIVPAPQEIRTTRTDFTLTQTTRIVLADDTPLIRHVAEMLQQDAETRYGLRLSLVRGDAAADGDIRVRVGRGWSQTLQPVLQREGYTLSVDATGITVVGADERGAFYGLHSLRQLFGPTPTVTGVAVRDWPDLPFRVAMVYLDVNSDDINPRLLPLLAAHKYNAVLVMSNYIRWQSAPELHINTGAPVAAARNLVRVARENGLEPIPLLETLGHVEWMFVNGQNRDLLPDPDVGTTFAYDPLNPRVYDALFPILGELIDIFEPRYLHIGHDEVRNVIPFPGNEAGRAVGFPRLFLDDTLRLYDYLADRGVTTMIWHDVLTSDDVRPLWPQFPKDMVVTMWRYVPAASYPPLRELQRAGFEVWGSSWYDPDNITALARDTVRTGNEGMIQTRWTGYFGNTSFLAGQYPQAYAYLTAANAFWNADAPPLTDAPARFRRLWQGTTDQTVRSGVLVDLSPYGTTRLDGQGERGWLGLSDGYAPVALADPELRLSGFRFDTGDAVSLRGSHRRVANDPERVTIPINRTVMTFAALHATSWSAPTNTEVGRYVVHYTDGSQRDIPLSYGTNISAWTELEVRSIGLEQPWRGTTPNGLDATAYLLTWDNPQPEVAVESIELVSHNTLANPVLFGLTLLD
ncbi:MAG: beta-N-acetylhexosaminidase [Trueperaceae bacterium]|nr:beta-N-acetylhexosaminidase [Trueperaceae bacterium]